MKHSTTRLTAIGLIMSLFLLAGVLSASRQTASANVADGQQKEGQNKKPAQQEAQDKDDTIRLGTDLIMLDVSVVDTTANNTAAMNLAQKDFQVFEDKAPQEIKFFSKEQVPVSVVFTIDSSGSMRSKIETVIKASINLVKESRKDDEMAVI